MRIIEKIIFKALKKLVSPLGYDLRRTPAADTALYCKIYGKESVDARRFYNLGTGAYLGFGGGLHHPCWTNIDLDRSWKKTDFHDDQPEFNPLKDIAHDLLSMQPLPVDTLSAELVHTRFTIASLTDQAAAFMFREVFRILKKGGIFRISTPNIDLDYRAYLSNDRSFFYWFGSECSFTLEQAFLFHVATQLSMLSRTEVPRKMSDDEFRTIIRDYPPEDALNRCTSQCSIEIHRNHRQDHINWWNPTKLERMLREAGFETVYLSQKEQSAASVMRNEAHFDNEDNRFVMYMEAVKS